MDEANLYLNVIPIIRRSDSPHRCGANTCDCGGGCGKRRGAETAAEVAPDKQEDCGFFWNGGLGLYFNAVKENPDWPNCWRGLICAVVHAGKDRNTWRPLWYGPFADEESYPFYAPSIDAARRAIEKKVREKIEANYSKWARLKEAWKPLED